MLPARWSIQAFRDLVRTARMRLDQPSSRAAMAFMYCGRVVREPFYCVPLRIMSFLTDFTPLMPLATSTALLISARDLTKPLN